jgi:hypothetical protein
MLGGGGEAIPRREVLPLEAPRLGFRHPASDPCVLAGALDDPPPARIARHVEHRREGQGDAIVGRLFRRRLRRLLPKVGSEQAGFREGDGKNRVVAVNDVEAQEQGNAEAGFLDREALDGARFVGAPEIEQAPDPPRPYPFMQVTKLARAGDRARRGDHVELPDLFLDRHRREQRIDASHALCPAFGGSRRDSPFFLESLFFFSRK